MKYISNSRLAQAILNIRKYETVDDAFFGLLFIFKNSNIEKEPIALKRYSFDENATSSEVTSIFSFEEQSPVDPKDNFFILNENYENIVYNTLTRTKINIFDVAIICMHKEALPDTLTSSNFVDKFLQDFKIPNKICEACFQMQDSYEELKTVASKVSLEDTLKSLKTIFKDKSTNRTISFGKKHFLSTSAGDWGRGAYAQKFKPSSSIKNSIFIPSSDLQCKIFDLSDQKAKTKNNIHTKNLNKIYFGPAGTGKSYQSRKELNDKYGVEEIYEVTFHPEYSYHDFVGSLRPVLLYKKENGCQVVKTPQDDTFWCENCVPFITYQFEPGPFTKAIVQALKDENKTIGLLIDELNRGNVSEILGDIFQLLDRNEDYGSESNSELIQFIQKDFPEYKKLKLPSNLIIRATINPSDQNTHPLDTAFKRRWDWEYTDIDYNHPKCTDLDIYFAKTKMKWTKFISKLNELIIETLDLPEDKQMGHFFIQSDGYDNEQKILKYLWEDIPRHKRHLIFNSDIKTFSNMLAINEKNVLSDLFNQEFALAISDEEENENDL